MKLKILKTENQLTNDILKITLLIQEKFPELSKYISEFTITIPNIDDPEINRENLTDYYNSLVLVLKKYAFTHYISSNELKLVD